MLDDLPLEDLPLDRPARDGPALARTARAGKPIGVALQGGGSWGAYTWGVLDALLRSTRWASITQLSGTSAGAINAAIVASGLAKGSAKQARSQLRSFWLSIADPPISDLVRALWGPLRMPWAEATSEWLSGSGLMPMLGARALAALRQAVTAHVDVEAIKGKSAPALFITATNVRTGLPRVFSNDEMSVEALLASACLPHLFPAVEIDGEHYWDGGYGGNPTLWPMIRSGRAEDLIIVQLAPDRVEQIPVDAQAVRRRVGEVVFHSSLVAEMQAIHAMRGLSEPGTSPTRFADLRLHRIGPPRTELLENGTGTERGRAWLEQLHGEGLDNAKAFIARHGKDIGVRETLDIAQIYIDTHKPKIRVVPSAPNAERRRAAADGSQVSDATVFDFI